MARSFHRHRNSAGRAVLSALLGVGIAVGAGAARADAGKRVALVIGNDAYANAARLENPIFDAKAIAEKLRHLGFDVSEGYDLDEAALRGQVGAFSDKARTADAALVYFSGQGVASDSDNYLIPVDLDPKRPADLDLHALSLEQILRAMRNDDRPDSEKLVFLDACRDSPFARYISTGARKGTFLRGLVAVEPNAKGASIVFAASPETTCAAPASGAHSPFAEALLEHVEDADAPIAAVIDRVRKSVDERTEHAQSPWAISSSVGELKLNAVADASTNQDSDAELKAEVGTWVGEKALNLSVNDVKALQRRLAALKFYRGRPTGAFDDSSRTAIAAWQQDRGLVPTGELGPLQRLALVASKPVAPPEADLKAEVGAPATEKALAFSPDEIQEVQVRLALLDFLKMPPNGAFDAPTRAALTNWQKSAGVAATGYLGPLQLDALRARTDQSYESRMANEDATSPNRRIAPPSRLRVAHRHHWWGPRGYGLGPNFGFFPIGDFLRAFAQGGRF